MYMIRKVGVAAITMLVASTWMVAQGWAHVMNPLNVSAMYVEWTSASTNQVRVRWTNPSGVSGRNYPDDTLLNWCKAKSSLPAGWDTQSDRQLRTDSMCAETPGYTGYGTTIANTVVAKANPNYRFNNLEPGRYIFSVTFRWTELGHHNSGNHASLSLADIQQPAPPR